MHSVKQSQPFAVTAVGGALVIVFFKNKGNMSQHFSFFLCFVSYLSIEFLECFFFEMLVFFVLFCLFLYDFQLIPLRLNSIFWNFKPRVWNGMELLISLIFGKG